MRVVRAGLHHARHQGDDKGYPEATFSVDTDSLTMELLSEKEQIETTEKLLEMIDDGKINEAGNVLWMRF